jgi:hypothetical protein
MTCIVFFGLMERFDLLRFAAAKGRRRIFLAHHSPGHCADWAREMLVASLPAGRPNNEHFLSHK